MKETTQYFVIKLEGEVCGLFQLPKRLDNAWLSWEKGAGDYPYYDIVWKVEKEGLPEGNMLIDVEFEKISKSEYETYVVMGIL